MGNKRVFTIDNDYIRKLVPFELTDNECKAIAGELECRFDDFVATWAREYRFDHPARHSGHFVKGTLIRREWVRDYAVEVGEVEFDCFLALEQFKLSELPPCADDFHGKGYLDHGDELFWKSVELGLVADWDGPFDMYVDSFDYERYMDERVQREYGYGIFERM